MRKVAEYEQHAEECRRMATGMKDPKQRQQLQEMAAAWEMLAVERKKQLAKQEVKLGPNEFPAEKFSGD